MRETKHPVVSPGRPERKHRRFLASYPVQLKFHLEDAVFELQTITTNVSVGGLLLKTASPVPQHCFADFVMTLHGGPLVRPIRVVGEGQVVRVQPHRPGPGFDVAIKCKRVIELNLSEFAG
jgi:hypothetical protein